MSKRIFFHSPIRYIVSFVLGILLTVLYLALTSFKYLRSYADAFLLAGGVQLLFSLLVLVTFYGTFDIFTFTFSRISKSNRERYRTLYDYDEAQKAKRSKQNPPYVPYMVVGAFYLAIAGILFIINSIG